ADLGGACEIRPQNEDHGPHLAGGGKSFHERVKSDGEIEDRAIAIAPAVLGVSVEAPVGVLNQPSERLRSIGTGEGMQRRKLRARSDFEDRAIAVRAIVGCSVEAPVGGLDQPCGRSLSALAAEAVQNGERSGGSNLEDLAVVGFGPALVGCAV